jgi:hypothetical protein
MLSLLLTARKVRYPLSTDMARGVTYPSALAPMPRTAHLEVSSAFPLKSSSQNNVYPKDCGEYILDDMGGWAGRCAQATEEIKNVSISECILIRCGFYIDKQNDGSNKKGCNEAHEVFHYILSSFMQDHSHPGFWVRFLLKFSSSWGMGNR